MADAVADAVVMVSASALVASDRGRVLPVDLACLAPLVVWAVQGRTSLRVAGRVTRRP